MAQLTTTAKVKARIGITDATDDALISELIDQVSDFIQDYTGRWFTPHDAQTFVVDTASGSEIDVPRGVRAVTALGLASSDQPDTAGTYSALTPISRVVLRPSPLERRDGWPATRILITGGAAAFAVAAVNGASITGDFGFAAVPPAIEAIATDAVVTAYSARNAGASEVVGAGATAIEPWSRFFGAGTAQLETLERYRAGTRGFA